MKHLAAIAAVFTLIAPAGASAHFLPHRHGLTRAERVAYFERSVRHDRGALDFFKRTLTSVHESRERQVFGRLVQWHREALRWHRDLLGRARLALEREQVRREAASLPPHHRAWDCIHGYEGSWSDAGAPYYGGLQFGYSEWMTYGYPYTHVTTANLASPLQQEWAAERYWRVSGFHPWPQTARYCGLL